jgi:hypothetical protein
MKSVDQDQRQEIQEKGGHEKQNQVTGNEGALSSGLELARQVLSHLSQPFLL